LLYRPSLRLLCPVCHRRPPGTVARGPPRPAG
jgi:hypothetical protein